MIGYLKGKVLYFADTTVLLECNGVGYEIACSSSVYQKLVADKEGEVFTYLAVREDGISLYGFISMEEKNMFLKLISVSGVGPKMGITILSNMQLSDLAVKIATSDVKGLSSIKGLGKKTAERIILELREKVSADTNSSSAKTEDVPDFTEVNEDAVIALMSLGFTKAECVKAVKEAYANGHKSIEQLIAYSIKNIR